MDILETLKLFIEQCALSNLLTNKKYFYVKQAKNREKSGIYLNIFFDQINKLAESPEDFFEDIPKSKCNTYGKNLSKKFITCFSNYLVDKRIKNVGRISRIEEIITNFNFNKEMNDRIQHLKKNGLEFFMSSRGDGNCFYRAIIVSYIIILSKNGKLNEFINFLKNISNIENAFQIKECREEVEIVIGILEFVIRLSIINNIKNLGYLCIYLFVNLYDKFDLALIKILRILISKFYETNPDFDFEGLKLKDWVAGEGTNYPDFIENNVKKNGVVAKDSILPITAILLGVRIRVCVVDIQNSHMNSFINYRSSFSTFNLNNLGVPNMSKEEIVLLYKPGHYDALFNSNFDSLHETGEKFLIPLETYFEIKLNSITSISISAPSPSNSANQKNSEIQSFFSSLESDQQYTDLLNSILKNTNLRCYKCGSKIETLQIFECREQNQQAICYSCIKQNFLLLRSQILKCKSCGKSIYTEGFCKLFSLIYNEAIRNKKLITIQEEVKNSLDLILKSIDKSNKIRRELNNYETTIPIQDETIPFPIGSGQIIKIKSQNLFSKIIQCFYSFTKKSKSLIFHCIFIMLIIASFVIGFTFFGLPIFVLGMLLLYILVVGWFFCPKYTKPVGNAILYSLKFLKGKLIKLFCENI